MTDLQQALSLVYKAATQMENVVTISQRMSRNPRHMISLGNRASRMVFNLAGLAEDIKEEIGPPKPPPVGEQAVRSFQAVLVQARSDYGREGIFECISDNDWTEVHSCTNFKAFINRNFEGGEVRWNGYTDALTWYADAAIDKKQEVPHHPV